MSNNTIAMDVTTPQEYNIVIMTSSKYDKHNRNRRQRYANDEAWASKERHSHNEYFRRRYSTDAKFRERLKLASRLRYAAKRLQKQQQQQHIPTRKRREPLFMCLFV